MAKQVDLNKWACQVVRDKGKTFFVEQEDGKGLSTNDYTTAEKNKLSGIEAQANKTNVDSSLSTNSENPVQNKVINAALITKVDKEVGKGLFTGSYNDLTNKPTIPTNTSQLINDSGFITPNDINGGSVTVEQQASPDTGYTATYVIKQDGIQVGTKINIPKDFLVRRATVETSIANNSPQAGFIKGDKYLDFVVNTKDNSGVDEHLYINVNDLFNEYEADESTLTLSADNIFSIKNGVIPQANTTASNIKMNGAQSAGTANTWAKADHVHPVDTSRAASSHSHNKSDITDFPTSMTPTSHAHGSITNGGTLNTDTNNVNKVVVTDSNQNIRTISKIPYAKIDNTPTIPSKLSELTNDKGYVTRSEVAGNIDLTDYVKTDDSRLSDARRPTSHTHVKTDISDFPTLSTVATSGSYNDLSNKPTIPSIDSSLSSSSTNPVQNKVINNALAGKAASDHNHDGTYLKSYTPPTASTSQAGIVQLSDTISSTSKTQAATANAVKTAYDKGNHSHPYASNTHNHDGVYQPVGNYLTSHNPIDSSLSSTSTNAVQNKVINTALDSKTVTLTKLTGSNITSGYLSTYEIKQGTTSLGKIDIPKDYLVKSGSVKSVTTANSPVNGYAVGDKYIDFVVNTKDSSGTDEHIYINVKDLIDTYEPATQSANGLMSSSDKTKLDGIATGANAYTHPTPSGLGNAQTTAVFKKIKYDAQGHITGVANVTANDLPNHNHDYMFDELSGATYFANDGATMNMLGDRIVYDYNGDVYGTPDAVLYMNSDSDPINFDDFVTTDDSRLSDARTPTTHTHDDRYYTETEIQNNYVAKEDLEDMVGLSYDDSTGILTLTINTN